MSNSRVPGCNVLSTIKSDAYEDVLLVEKNGVQYVCFVSRTNIQALHNPSFKLITFSDLPQKEWFSVRRLSALEELSFSNAGIQDNYCAQNLLARLHSLYELNRSPDLQQYVLSFGGIQINFGSKHVYILQEHIATMPFKPVQDLTEAEFDHLNVIQQGQKQILEGFKGERLFIFDARLDFAFEEGVISVMSDQSSDWYLKPKFVLKDFISLVSADNPRHKGRFLFSRYRKTIWRSYFANSHHGQTLLNRIDSLNSHSVNDATHFQSVMWTCSLIAGGYLFFENHLEILKWMGVNVDLLKHQVTPAIEEPPPPQTPNDLEPDSQQSYEDQSMEQQSDVRLPVEEGPYVALANSDLRERPKIYRPELKIIKHFPVKGQIKQHYRNVYKVRFEGEYFKCYHILFDRRKAKDAQLKVQLDNMAKGGPRWLREPLFPMVDKIICDDSATNAENDLKCIFHAFTLLTASEGRKQLAQKYIPNFEQCRLLFTLEEFYILVPWQDATPLDSNPVDDEQATALVDTYLNMLEELHREGLCFYDLTIVNRADNGGNVLYRKNSTSPTGYQCVWIDFESICRLPDATEVNDDAEKVRYLRPSLYFPNYFNAATEIKFKTDHRIHSRSSQHNEYGWSTDVYFCLAELYEFQYISGPNVDNLLSALHLERYSTSSSKKGPFETRLKPSHRTPLVQKREKTTPVIQQKTDLSSGTIIKSGKKSANPPTDFKVSMKDKVIGKVLLVGCLVGFIYLVYSLHWGRSGFKSSSVFDEIEPLFLTNRTEMLKNHRDVLDKMNEDKGEASVAMFYYLQTLRDKEGTFGEHLCPVIHERLYANEKEMRKFFQEGNCGAVIDTIQSEAGNSNDIAVQFATTYYQLADCISRMGKGVESFGSSDKEFCVSTLQQSSKLVTSNRLPKWARVEQSLLWMVIINTNTDDLKIKNEVLKEVDKVCTTIIKGASDSDPKNSVLSTHTYFTINRCLINAKPKSMAKFLSMIHDNIVWSPKKIYKSLTENRPTSFWGDSGGRGTLQAQEQWKANDIHSFYSWIAESAHEKKVQPIPDLNCVAIGLGCDDTLGWKEYEKAMKSAFK